MLGEIRIVLALREFNNNEISTRKNTRKSLDRFFIVTPLSYTKDLKNLPKISMSEKVMHQLV